MAERLSEEVKAQTALEFEIFIDRKHLQWGADWRSAIRAAVGTTTLLFPVITPRYFRSTVCVEELDTFLTRERLLGRSDLVLPIYYINVPEPPEHNSELYKTILGRQYRDWRQLRTEDKDSRLIRTEIIHLATEVAGALRRMPQITDPAVSAYIDNLIDLKKMEQECVRLGLPAWDDQERSPNRYVGPFLVLTQIAKEMGFESILDADVYIQMVFRDLRQFVRDIQEVSRRVNGRLYAAGEDLLVAALAWAAPGKVPTDFGWDRIYVEPAERVIRSMIRFRAMGQL